MNSSWWEPSEWPSLNRWMEDQGDLLTMRKTSGKLPVPLSQIARQQLVKDVRFRPLIVDGCLTVIDDGFLIYVHCEEGNEEKLAEQFRNERSSERLPVRIRFTIAHEIAHTFFFDTKSRPPKATLTASNYKRLRCLESACDRVAGKILLPDPILFQEARRTDFLNPDGLRRLADKAGISAIVLVRRLEESRNWRDGVAGVVSVDRVGSEYRIRRMAMHPILKSYFPKAKRRSPFKALTDNPGFVLNGGKSEQVTLFGGRKKCIVTAEITDYYSPTKSYFVTIRRKEE